MIKYKGYQVAPAEIEDVLLKHPAVKDAAVIGIRNADLQSEVPLGYVTLKEGLLKDRKMALDILNHVKNHVIHYKQLHGGIIWTSHIPKSPSGKILKRVLREKAETVDKGNRIEATDYSRYGRAKI
jgi:acyl-coenzyme A synthetase/AMP-(fatty) acid ligase